MIQPADPDNHRVQENIDAKTRDLVGNLSLDGSAAEDALREWFEMFPESLYRLTAAGLTHKAELSVHRLLAVDRECSQHLCNTELIDTPAAVKLARSLILLDSRLDKRLAQAAIDWAAKANHKPLRRCLDILAAMTPLPGISDSLVQLLKCVDGAPRSKVVDILVRSSTDEVSIRKWLRDPDPRVRANVLESLVETGGEMEWIRQLLVEHLHDPHWRVAANAALGLCRRGVEETGLGRLFEMASSQDANVRCSSAWAMGRVAGARVFPVLDKLRKDPDSRVRWNALRSLSRIHRAGMKQGAPSEQAKAPAAELVAAG
jgi:hypothetical protein